MYHKVKARVIPLVLIGLFVILTGFGVMGQGTNGPQLIESTPVASGALLKEYFWLTANGPAKIFVLEVDLSNPYIEVETILGKGKVTERASVTAMAKDTKAIAAINGDFFNTQAEGAPIGPTVVKGELVTSPFNLGRVFAFGITQDKQAFINDFHFFGRVTASNGNSFQLSGLNKTIYTAHDNTHSHKDRLYLYDHMWGSTTRGHDGLTIPTEFLIHNNKVIKIYQGEYFNSRLPKGSYILRGSGQAAEFLTSNFKVGDEIEIDYNMLPHRDWSMLVGGHSLLVFNGQAMPYSKEKNVLDGLRARSAAGISQDGNTIYLVGVEGRTANSLGLTLDNLAQFFVHIGAWQALNLDGGGSTTMVTRPLGETEAQKVFSTEQQWERLVVNAIGIYSTAPQGELKDIILTGKDLLLPGETISYSLKAYDEYYNPMDINHLDVKWQLTGDVGVLTDNTLKATKAGKGKIMVTVNHITKELPITVLGEKDIKEFKLLAKDPSFDPQKPVSLVVSLITKDGKERDVPSSMAQWNLTGFKGSISPQGILTIEEWTKGGYISAIFNGLKATLNLEEDLIDKTAPWSKIGTVTVTGATVNIRSGPDTTHPVLTQVFRGVPLKVLGQQGDWLEVSLPNGTVGWIANWLVDYSPVPAVIIGNVVNIRKGPSVDQEVITQLKKGELVTVITKEKDWLKVVLPDDLTGWVADWLVEPKAAEE